jgi:hypothetical protein
MFTSLANTTGFPIVKERHFQSKFRGIDCFEIETVLLIPVRKTVLNLNCIAAIWKYFTVGRDNSVGTRTRYGLDGPGIESRLGARFSAAVQIGPEAHPSSYTMGTWSFPGLKRPVRGFEHSPHPPLGFRVLL